MPVPTGLELSGRGPGVGGEGTERGAAEGGWNLNWGRCGDEPHRRIKNKLEQETALEAYVWNCVFVIMICNCLSLYHLDVRLLVVGLYMYRLVICVDVV